MHVSAPHLIPLLGLVLLRGRCRHCRVVIDGFYLAIELAFLAIAAIAWGMMADDAEIWLACLLGWWLLTVAWIDAEHMILPDSLTLPLLLGGLAETYVLAPEEIIDHCVGCAGGFGVLQVTGWAFRRLRGHDGLGGGDARLVAAAGAWLGWEQLPWVLLTASLLGLATFLVARLRGQSVTPTTPLPFGPALSAAIWLQWLLTGARNVL